MSSPNSHQTQIILPQPWHLADSLGVVRVRHCLYARIGTSQNGLLEDHSGGYRIEPLRPDGVLVGFRPSELRPIVVLIRSEVRPGEVRPVEVRLSEVCTKKGLLSLRSRPTRRL